MSAEELFASLGRAVDELVVAARAVPPDDDAAAYAFVTDLSAALRRLPELLRLVPELADTADLGGTRRRRLEEWHEELQEREAEVALRLAELERVRPLVEELRRKAALRERLGAELDELRRLEALGAGLDTLLDQHALMDRRRAELAQVAEEEQRLGRAVRELQAVSAAELSGLREEVARAIDEGARTEADVESLRARLKAEQAELERLGAEHEELREEAGRRLPSLTLHRDAERALVEGLAMGALTKASGLRHAQRVMDEIDERLRALDAALKEALRIHDSAYEQAREDRPLTGGP
ncbi:hypothetical protein [Actinomadura rugatobispora]|uniref:Chromosome partition protein Smc n=1 Tax=Actinomadura rugatobispora TaxID=1994 RepID=A0ABW0ZYN4_9ACTN|nr:hypothetical protein GCM10010200_049670 [Actinomadura rugatobispora]